MPYTLNTMLVIIAIGLVFVGAGFAVIWRRASRSIWWALFGLLLMFVGAVIIFFFSTEASFFDLAPPGDFWFAVACLSLTHSNR